MKKHIFLLLTIVTLVNLLSCSHANKQPVTTDSVITTELVLDTVPSAVDDTIAVTDGDSSLQIDDEGEELAPPE